MDTGKAIFLGLALIALAIFATDAMRPAQAGLMGGGRYMGTATSNPAAVWIVDTETGAYAYCYIEECRPWRQSQE
jgi:hypothetical protein